MATTKRTGLEGGLWIIPLGLLLAAAWSGYRAIRAIKSGGTRQLPDGTWVDAGNVGWFETGGGWFCAGFLAAAIVSFLLMRKER